MNYELAKELKEAGFPQPFFNGKAVYGEDGVYRPKLEELIEACGKRFLWVQQTEEGEWEALSRSEPPTKEEKEQAERRGKRPMAHMSIGKGSTPTEAVARLYLSLNKKV